MVKRFCVEVTLRFIVSAENEEEVKEDLFKYIETSDWSDIIDLQIKECKMKEG